MYQANPPDLAPEENYTCPICRAKLGGGDKVYIDKRSGEIVGCECCLKSKEVWEALNTDSIVSPVCCICGKSKDLLAVGDTIVCRECADKLVKAYDPN